MRIVSSLRSLVPQRLFEKDFAYAQLPLDSRNGSRNNSPFESPSIPGGKHTWLVQAVPIERLRCFRPSLARAFACAVLTLLLLILAAGGGYRHRLYKAVSVKLDQKPPDLFYWQHYSKLNGYYNGVRMLVPLSQYEPQNQYNTSYPPERPTKEEAGNMTTMPPIDPIPYRPYPDYKSAAYLEINHPVQECFLDVDDEVRSPDIYAYPGIPQHMPLPLSGSYSELGLNDEVCFDRFGRLGPYGYGYNVSQGGLMPGLPGNRSENVGHEKVVEQAGITNYTNMDWGFAQKECHDRNQVRFSDNHDKERVKRHAYVLRTWTGYYYNENQILSLRAMINELSLKSGGEYDVHLLVHVKDNTLPIWADKNLHRQVLERNVPREFWNISTLWSEAQMMAYYPEPFPDNFANMAGKPIHGVYRSAHFALQWFSQRHPEYDFYWNWEMDIRYSGHYYEFNSKVSDWARKQPRKGIWERSGRFYIPGYHGDWQNFTNEIEKETAELNEKPIWGPVRDFPHSGMLDPPTEVATPPTTYDEDKYTWGVGEDADLIVFNPLFDPSRTNWVFSWDVTGYNRTFPIPPRRAAIITVARLSKRLLDLMHEETWRLKHTMFPEMWPPTVALHHGLKAVYAPQPVFFDRDWNLEYMDKVFNHPVEEWESPFGWGEHNLLGATFYYNSGFSGALWRRWLGQRELGEGGRADEVNGTGRMCLRGTMHHPIKHELAPVE